MGTAPTLDSGCAVPFVTSSGVPTKMSTVSFSGSVALVAVVKFRRFSGVVPGGNSYPLLRAYVRSLGVS